ncbi:MAG: uracil phosphoribosyltransferase [Alphaproteobacteria bacterium]|nr:uracil phosphoribosyltransferase [Alphaproteobacteria bacterium]
MHPNVHVAGHPLVQHKLTLMRRKETPTAEFRRLMREIGMLLAYEVTRDLKLATERIETPVAPMDAPVLAGKKLCVIAVMRAGAGLLDGFLDLIPSARVGHIGLYRDPTTLVPVEYYMKVPHDIAERPTVVVDPLVATGHSAAAACQRLKDCGAADLRLVCILAAPEALEHLAATHPDVPVHCAAIDQRLDEHAFIVPGLGDAGDRLYGTK